ncbi:MAG TPA: carbohydrate ABC transporter permease [Chloroflexota bacterium]|jgi:multiple sugar transport system permease protein|nr:carbohydrate ABC transporter permease [Chloroflexota bacterium]
MSATARAHPLSASLRPGRLSYLVGRALFYAVTLVVVGATLFPLYWMFVTSARVLQENGDFPPLLWPRQWDWSPYVSVFTQFPLGRWLYHSLEVAGLVTVLVLVFATLGAYPLACMGWRGRSTFGFFLFFTQMMPEAMIVVPIYVLYRRIGIVENLPALAVVDAAFVVPVGVWILKSVFEGVPSEVREAAQVDGCSQLGVLWRIILPLSKGGLVAVAVSAFFYGWNEYLFASTMITLEDIRPASLGLASFLGFSGPLISRAMAGGWVYAVIPTIFYLVAQRQLVVGLTAGAVKG